MTANVASSKSSNSIACDFISSLANSSIAMGPATLGTTAVSGKLHVTNATDYTPAAPPVPQTAAVIVDGGAIVTKKLVCESSFDLGMVATLHNELHVTGPSTLSGGALLGVAGTPASYAPENLSRYETTNHVLTLLNVHDAVPGSVTLRTTCVGNQVTLTSSPPGIVADLNGPAVLSLSALAPRFWPSQNVDFLISGTLNAAPVQIFFARIVAASGITVISQPAAFADHDAVTLINFSVTYTL